MTEQEQPQIFRERYKILKKLGAGNFGTAYLVSDLKSKSERKVLKVVRLGEMDNDQTVDSVREATLLSHLHNEYIVKFYESFSETDCLCIVTEYCEGGDLDQLFKELKKQNRRLEEDQILQWLIQILIAVQYMHKSRILHRDLKARNIFLKSNQVKIGDFGISRILVGTMDVANTFTGTPYYMSPEVMKHDGYESKSDIWSVGCLLYEMCTYQHAFDGKGLMNVIYKVVEGNPPELPEYYSPQLNELLKRMFIKDPKLRPSAVELLQTPYIQGYLQKIHMNTSLETTVSARGRLKNLHSQLETPVNFGDMQKQSWSLTSEDNRIVEDEEDFNHDDDDDVKLGNNTFYKTCPSKNPDEEQISSRKEEATFKTARQTMIERKMHKADAIGQVYTDAIRSSKLENDINRQLMRKSTIGGTMNTPWPSAQLPIDVKEQTRSPFAQTMNSRTRHIQQEFDNATLSAHVDSARSKTIRQSVTTYDDDRPLPTTRQLAGTVTVKTNPSNTVQQRTNRYSDDRPITPMRTTYRQVAAKFNKEDGLPTDPSLTNQYYENCNDFEQYDDHSPTRDIDDEQFNDLICRSINGDDFSSRNNDDRPLSASSRSTINSMSRTIDPRYGSNAKSQSKYLPSSKTISGTRKHKISSGSFGDGNTTSFKDNPAHDAFGPLAKTKKIASLRSKAIEQLGRETFDKVHDYLIKQRTMSSMADAEITEGLRAFVNKPIDGFLVDQLVFLELFANDK